MSNRLRIVPLYANPKKRKKKPARARKAHPPARVNSSRHRARAGSVKIIRMRRNSYSQARGAEPRFDIRMRAHKNMGGMERYNRIIGTPHFESDDPLDAAFPAGRRPRRLKLKAYTDAGGTIHPIRHSEGYDPSRTTDHKRRRRPSVQVLGSNPRRKARLNLLRHKIKNAIAVFSTAAAAKSYGQAWADKHKVRVAVVRSGSGLNHYVVPVKA